MPIERMTKLEELDESIYPKYQEARFLAEKADLIIHSTKLITTIYKRGENFHIKLDNIIKKLKN